MRLIDSEIDGQISRLLKQHAELVAKAAQWTPDSFLLASNCMDIADRLMEQIERLRQVLGKEGT